MLQKYKKIIGIVLGVLVLFVLYSAFFKKTPEAALSSSNTSSLSGEDNELLVLLSQLKTIKLEGGLFVDPLFTSLNDFTVHLTLEPRQRQNPFAPIGTDSVVPVTQTGTSTVGGTGL